MITIKTQYMTITRSDNKVTSAVGAQGSVYIKFADNIEIIIPVKSSGILEQCLTMMSRSSAKNVLLDLTNSKPQISFSEN